MLCRAGTSLRQFSLLCCRTLGVCSLSLKARFPFALGVCWVDVCGEGEERGLCVVPPPLHHPINAVDGTSIFSPAKPSALHKLNTSHTLLGLTPSIRQGWGFLTIGGGLINLVYIRRLGKSERGIHVVFHVAKVELVPAATLLEPRGRVCIRGALQPGSRGV